MSEPFLGKNDVCEAESLYHQLREDIEFNLLAGDPPDKADVMELLELAADMLTQLKFEFEFA